jgi:hypothetical protein
MALSFTSAQLYVESTASAISEFHAEDFIAGILKLRGRNIILFSP